MRDLQDCHLRIYGDSQLEVNQVNDIYLAIGEMMATYLEKAKELIGTFLTASIEFILRSKNANANALATGFNKGCKTAGCNVLGIPGRTQRQATTRNNEAKTGAFMDGSHHRIFKERRAIQRKDRSSYPKSKSSSLRTLR